MYSSTAFRTGDGGCLKSRMEAILTGVFIQKEKDFYQHIKRHRVDPSSQSVSNPVPDYYGEKIDSLKAYRQWLKDQRAFTRKRQSY